jgi:hypothetical protein
MKKLFLGAVITAATLGLTGLGWAEMVMGDLVKIDGSFYVVKDSKGKEHRIHFDPSTKKEGDIKAGAHVEVDNDNGHAKSIKVVKM